MKMARLPFPSGAEPRAGLRSRLATFAAVLRALAALGDPLPAGADHAGGLQGMGLRMENTLAFKLTMRPVSSWPEIRTERVSLLCNLVARRDSLAIVPRAHLSWPQTRPRRFSRGPSCARSSGVSTLRTSESVTTSKIVR